MRLPLQNDNSSTVVNSSIVVNLHRYFEVDAHFLQLDDNI